MKTYQQISIVIAIFCCLFLFFGLTEFVFAIPAMQQRCEPNTECIIGEYVFDDDGHTPITADGFCQITITDPSDAVIVNGASMPDKNDGWYYYSTSTLSAEGLYRSKICCDVGNPGELCIDKTFVVGTSFNNLAEKIWSYTGSALDTANNAIAKTWSYSSRTLTAFGSLAADVWNDTYASVRKLTSRQISGSSEEIARQYDVELIRQATFDFAGYADSGSTTTLTDAELTQPDDYWNDYRLKIMSGSNVGEERTVSDFDAASDTITVSSAFPNAIASGDKYVLLHEDRLVYKIWNYTSRTLTSAANVAGDIWSYTGGRTLTTLGSIAADVWNDTFAPIRKLTGKELTGGGSLATESYIDTATSTVITTLRGSSTSTDLTTLAGYVDEVEGYIGVPTDTATTTLFGSIRDVRTKLNQLDALETKIDTIDAVVDLIRASQLLGYTLELSDVGEILETKDYRAKLTILDYESNPVDASSTPSVVLYDALRAIATSTAMTKLSTGVYEFVYTVPSGAANGTWETLVNVNLGGSADIQLNDYWEVEGSPAQVKINEMSDVTVPTISANVTISNEGSTGYEYQYEYCVVAQEDNQCGGGDDVAYATAAKYLDAGQDWTTDLELTVSDAGSYWFKIVVYWGTEASGASQTFNAQVGGGETAGAPSAGVVGAVSLDNVYNKLLEVQEDIGYRGKPGVPRENIKATVYETLKVLSERLEGIAGSEGCGLCNIFKLEKEQANNIDYLKNKLSELRALLDVNKLLIDKAANKPVIKTWFEWGSVILKMLVINPSSSQSQTIPFKAYLPREVRPEYIIDREDLALDFDAEKSLWYVHKEIRLPPGGSATKKVEIKDIWTIPEEEIGSLRSQFEEMLKPLEGTAFYAQAVTLKSDADRLLDGIVRKQNEYKATPQEHIVAYRENMESLKAVESNLEALKKLVAEESGAGRAMGSLFGVSTTMTWAIIIIVITGISVLMILLYSLLMKQRALTHHITGGQKIKAPPIIDLRKRVVKIKGGFITYFLPPFGKPIVDISQLFKIIRFLVIVAVIAILAAAIYLLRG